MSSDLRATDKRECEICDSSQLMKIISTDGDRHRRATMNYLWASHSLREAYGGFGPQAQARRI